MWWKKKESDESSGQPEQPAIDTSSRPEESQIAGSSANSNDITSKEAGPAEETEKVEPSSPAAVFEFGGVLPAGALSMQGVCNLGAPSSLQPCIWLVEPTREEDSKAGQQKFHIEF
ncbi:hypothetical protein WJX74_009030 [Apatococcus lobatus]|uniref:Uncharacterized protein n=1 Tax=Apatococcus lobatus TaxID=904363 RepID=A0AAW1R0B6_9CHLO